MKTTHMTPVEVKDLFRGANFLKDVIALAHDEFSRRGEVICEFIINGIALTEEDEKKFESSPISEIQTLEIKSEQPHILLDESLAGCREYLEKLLSALETAAMLFRRENLQAAHTHHKTCIEGAQWFIQMMTHYKAVYIHLRGPLPETWINLETDLAQSLTDLLDAYDKKNYILVADLVEYDLIDIFGTWHRELSQMERSKNSEPRLPPEVSA